MSKIKETIYDTNEVDNLYKIVDKLVELRNKPFKNNLWNDLIEKKELYGFETNNDFYHLTDLKTFKKLQDL